MTTGDKEALLSLAARLHRLMDYVVMLIADLERCDHERAQASQLATHWRVCALQADSDAEKDTWIICADQLDGVVPPVGRPS